MVENAESGAPGEVQPPAAETTPRYLYLDGYPAPDPADRFAFSSPPRQKPKPCGWLKALFCREQWRPIYHSWECERCGRISYD